MKNSTFSQAPGTVVVLSCSLNKEMDVTVTCQDDGQWEPNPDDLLCTAGIIYVILEFTYILYCRHSLSDYYVWYQIN
jgi:hypothetical protein